MSHSVLAAPPRVKPTLKDVALRAGVDKSCVSVVLNGARSSANVSATVRERILEAARDLDYRPHAVGRALSRRRTHLLGFYSSEEYVNARNSFFSELIGGMQDGCENSEQELVMFSRMKSRPTDEVCRALTNGTIDGLVLFSKPDAPLVQALARTHLPVVAVTDALPELPSVVVDDAGGGRLQARYLYERGHRCVLYQKRRRSQTSDGRRWRAFQAEAHQLGLEIIESTESDYSQPGAQDVNPWQRPDAQRATAGVGWGDYAAYHLLDMSLKCGWRVPEDKAILGFDGFYLRLPVAQQLTTIHAPWAQVGSTAIELLMKRIEGHDVPLETTVPVELVVGDTT